MNRQYIPLSLTNTMLRKGVEGMYFFTFSAKNAIHHSSLVSWSNGNYTISTTCSFTGKEKDFETGYHYFGARYYDSELLTSWLSVDPMADKYPGISSYAYCSWNPVKLVDPNGDTLDVVNKKGQFLFSLDDSQKGRSSITAKNLYDKGVQWSEPNADNYMPLLSVNKGIESIDQWFGRK